MKSFGLILFKDTEIKIQRLILITNQNILISAMYFIISNIYKKVKYLICLVSKS